MINRLYVEKKPDCSKAAEGLRKDLEGTLGVRTGGVRIFLRYDVEGLEGADYERSVKEVFSEPPVDFVYREELPALGGYAVFGAEYLPGQYDQRADSAAQCVQLLTQKARPAIRCAVIYAVKGADAAGLAKIKKYLINPVEARECGLGKPSTLNVEHPTPSRIAVVKNFVNFTHIQIAEYHKENGFAMSAEDLGFVQKHFIKEGRDPKITELKVIDTYWSDHCRHTTFLTELKKVEIKSEIPQIKAAYTEYLDLHKKHFRGRTDKYPCLMDMATIGARELKARGLLDNLEESGEINACSIRVKADVGGQEQDWLVMFKNETHNHPTEIEPFGGAATCLGGAIRDPLSGRAYVYQAMRVSGAADPTAPLSETLEGKLPQRVICKTAAAGFSSYGNQIGLATGIVKEIYHPGYVAKRLEAGFVVGAAPAENVVRGEPMPGDIVVLVGGETGRDGCGGATGSSKAHDTSSLSTCGAEVQKGNAPEERKIQRLFRNPELTRLIVRCNDFGAGGVSVAVGELAAGIDINLDAVPLKYAGLDATEIAISESQERMAVVIKRGDEGRFKELCKGENLRATVIAEVTDKARMRMFARGETVVDLDRGFLDTNGVRQTAAAVIGDEVPKNFSAADCFVADVSRKDEKSGRQNAAPTIGNINNILSSLAVCSRKGLIEIFDSTVGAGTVLMPLGGREQLTPAQAMAAKLPVLGGETDTATVAANAYYPYLSSQSPFVGSVYAVALSAIKVVLAGAPRDSIRLSLQEFFPRVKDDPKRWGLPASALLGALHAQLGLGLAAIGGKDSMSGSFEQYDVPPTLISFALGVAKASKVVGNVLDKAGSEVWLLPLKRDKYGMPDLGYLGRLLDKIGDEIDKGTVSYAAAVEEEGVAARVIISCLGNNLGFEFRGNTEGSLGDILMSGDLGGLKGFDKVPIGRTAAGPHFGDISLSEARAAFEGKLEGVYRTVAAAEGDVRTVSFSTADCFADARNDVKGMGARCAPLQTGDVRNDVKRAAECRPYGVVKPRVLIPVFPGTNGEYDMAEAFRRAGAQTEFVVVKNAGEKDIADTVKETAAAVGKAQIIAFPGGFSGGDEPDGSGKFIAATFRAKRLADAVGELLEKRGGLILGFCNGFQALIKLGLLPYGKIGAMREDSPTLSFNNIARHVSTIAKIRVASNLSPWFSGVKTGDVFSVPVSHGEGRFLATCAEIEELIARGQIATQYVDAFGEATMVSPFNPNGSMMAVEGITSPCGRILGKMGHSERVGRNLFKNVPGEYDMRIFESGVRYFD